MNTSGLARVANALFAGEYVGNIADISDSSMPVLCLSRYILRYRAECYGGLQAVLRRVLASHGLLRMLNGATEMDHEQHRAVYQCWNKPRSARSAARRRSTRAT